MSVCADEMVFTRYYSDEAIERAKKGYIQTDEWEILGSNNRAFRKPPPPSPPQ